ncbi:alkaline phosphatase [Kineococcus auxinigenes]|uniref:alkaline phosphatase n=1 Tax=unclassified Kineococcus TaxID=2621656 RepID=UPI003D7ED59B
MRAIPQTRSRRIAAGLAAAGVITTVTAGAGVAAEVAQRPESRSSLAPAGADVQAKSAPATSAPTAKNVILFVGDGMGAAHRAAGRLALAGLDRELYMDSLPVSGLVHTSPDDPEAVITDSAAGATAYATGVKTFNGAVGVDPRGNAIPTVLERASDAGKATGLVTTGQITDATPAAFAAHVADRGEQSVIAEQYLTSSRPDVLLGGGEDWWLPEGEEGAFPDAPAEDPEEGSRSDRGDLLDRAQDEGYTYVNSAESLAQAEGGKLLGLFANQEMFQQNPEGEGDVYDPVVSLEQMTAKAIQTLADDEEGFFLVVEEEGVDEFAHSNNAARTVQAVDELDKAVLAAKTFAERDGETLVITTADHETGGMSVESVDEGDESGAGEAEGISAEDGPFPIARGDREFVVDWTTSGHTGVDVPLTAYGPGSELLTGVYENTYVHDAMLAAMRIR